MKINFPVAACLGGALLISATQAQAAAPHATLLPLTATVGPTPPPTISVSGSIPDYLEFLSVDTNLEFKDLGGPTSTGLPTAGPDQGYVASQSGGAYSGSNYMYNGSIGLNTDGTFVQTADGKAGVQFRSNSYIVVQTRANKMRNPGQDPVSTADDTVLDTSFMTHYRGMAASYNVATPLSAGSTTLSPTPNYVLSAATDAGSGKGFNGAISVPWVNVATDGAVFSQMIFKPWQPAPTDYAAKYANSAFVIIGRAKRSGLADYRGTYTGSINLTYFKF